VKTSYENRRGVPDNPEGIARNPLLLKFFGVRHGG
jgi:hypothetical protein